MAAPSPIVDVRRELDPEVLLAAAQAEAGLTDFVDQGFREPMARLLEAAGTEAGLNVLGVTAWKATIQSALVNRLRLYRDLETHPEIAEEDVSAPIVLVGLPRTGTTKLHRMLSAVPNVQQLLLWRLLNPAPFPGWRAAEPDPRIDVAKAYETMLWDGVPDLMAGHPMGAEQPDEETLLMETSFEFFIHAIRLHVPTYLSWVRQRSLLPTYNYLRLQLQYLQWQDGGRRGRPWIMKSPLHSGNIDTLMATFPGAIVVQCHRDPAVVIPSMARLTESYRKTQCDLVDLTQIGATQLAIWSEELSKNLAKRDQLEGQIPIFDVQYSEIVDEPLTVIDEIFRRAGWSLTPDVERKMTSAAELPHRGSGRHEYSLERYGLSAEEIRTHFGSYTARFIRDR
jgi:hypothetical protein